MTPRIKDFSADLLSPDKKEAVLRSLHISCRESKYWGVLVHQAKTNDQQWAAGKKPSAQKFHCH